MTAHEAKLILTRFKNQLRDRIVRDAIDKALEALAWEELHEKLYHEEEIKEIQDEIQS